MHTPTCTTSAHMGWKGSNALCCKIYAASDCRARLANAGHDILSGAYLTFSSWCDKTCDYKTHLSSSARPLLTWWRRGPTRYRISHNSICVISVLDPSECLQDAGLCIMLLTAAPDSFFKLSAARVALEAELSQQGSLQVRRAHPKP